MNCPPPRSSHHSHGPEQKRIESNFFFLYTFSVFLLDCLWLFDFDSVPCDNMDNMFGKND